jgi:hypothetical protein
VNFGFYREVLRRLHENVQRRRPELWREQTWLLHKDNARYNTTVLNQQFLAKYKSYFPDMAPSDLFLLPKNKLKLKRRRFDTIVEIQAESQSVLDTLTEKNFHEAFQKWRRRCDRCLHAGRNYFEGDGGRFTLWRVL